ncbi:PAS domain S-box protein [Candidatus Methylospira mobilis]|nr:PAS domain S-box protein [Candidatus Methylospira mobilis]WNV04847.1 PAS domain S-box protein [Candidatus Methylospira mobilis]
MHPIRRSLERLRQVWHQSIRRQLAWSFSLVSLTLILGSGYLLFRYQRNFQYAQSTEGAIGLAQALSFSSVSWVLADDVAGLQEVLKGATQTKDIKFAVVLSPQGEVLASTRSEYIGQSLGDAISLRLLTLQPEPHILLNASNLIDVAVPIKAGNRPIGWVRVELTRDTVNANLRKIAFAGIGIAVFLLLMIAIIAAWIARSLTSGLDRLAKVAINMEHGQAFQRAEIERADEIGVLARQLYRMLDAIAAEKKASFESSARLRMIFNTAHDLIWLKDMKGVYLACNPMFERFLGAKEAEIIGKTDHDFAGTGLADFFLSHDRRAMASGNSITREKWVTFADDRYKALLEIVITPIEDASEHLTGVLGIAHDITARKQTEIALKRESEKNLALLRNASDGIHILNINGNIIEASESFCAMLGYRRAEIIGMHVSQWDAQFVGADIGRILDQQFAQQGRSQFETRHRRKDGTVFDVEVSGFPLELESKPVLFNSSRDITERKKMEEELKRSNAELDQFAYAVSHDMRQPLRMVASYLTLLEKALAGRLDEDTREYLSYAIEGAKRMDQMILAMLDFSRVGRKTDPITPISSREVLDDTLAMLKPDIIAGDGAVEVTGDWPELVASRDELMRLLQNLIGNALKYHEPDQPPCVEVHAAATPALFRVTVRDRGIGIDPNQTERLFKVFSRLQARTRFEGTGVGLALCRKIVEHHGGRIGVESAGEGCGSTFWFELPMDTRSSRQSTGAS